MFIDVTEKMRDHKITVTQTQLSEIMSTATLNVALDVESVDLIKRAKSVTTITDLVSSPTPVLNMYSTHLENNNLILSIPRFHLPRITEGDVITVRAYV